MCWQKSVSLRYIIQNFIDVALIIIIILHIPGVPRKVEEKILICPHIIE